jgi:amino acid adenylation domain-containing protein
MIARIEHLLQSSYSERGDAVAIVDGDESLTYRQLEVRSSHVAEILLAGGLRRDDRVCLLVPKSIGAIVVVVGILKAGGVYVPLDCGSPPMRLSSMTQRCGPCWLIVDSAHLELAAAVVERSKHGDILGAFQLDRPFAVSPVNGLAEMAQHFRSDDGGDDHNLAYILFTSGSTGDAKGVPIPHENVVEYVAWANTHFGAKTSDRISSHSPLHFDMSVWDVFGTLAAGAQLHLVPTQLSLTPHLIAEFMRSAQLTQWYSVPSILIGMAQRNVVRQGDFPHLRRIIWGGEALPVPVLRYLMERLPHVVFTNVYGPTEATVNCTHHTVTALPPDSDASVPIGLPIPGRKLKILDDGKNEVPVGQVGTLYVGGIGLSPGYWREPAKTAAAFCSMPEGLPDRWYRTGDLAHVDDGGVYHFHGRADRQIKSRGYRIELDDIAIALSRVSGLRESAVVAVTVGGFEGMRICAAYTLAPGCSRTAGELKSALAAALPPYMLPKRWLQLEEMPRNVSGKTDLAGLQKLFSNE